MQTIECEHNSKNLKSSKKNYGDQTKRGDLKQNLMSKITESDENVSLEIV